MNIGRLELLILKIIWKVEAQEEKDLSVSDVFNLMSKLKNSNRAYTTIKTVMDRLVEKSILIRYSKNNKFYYKSVISFEEIVRGEILNFAELYFDSDLNSLLLAVKKECELVNV